MPQHSDAARALDSTARRVLMIAERFPPDLGGLARSAARTAGALARLGVAVDVLAWTRTLPPGTLESGPAGEVVESATGATLHRLGLFANLDLSMQHTSNVLEWLHGERDFQAVWGHYIYPAGFMAVSFAETMGIASTVSARGNDVDRLMFPPGDFARLTWTLDRAGVVTAVSRDLAHKIDMLLGRDAKVAVVPNVVDLERFRPGPHDPALRESLGIASDEAVMCFCGELRHKKGLPFLLSALADVRRDRPACLLVIGEVRAREQEVLARFRAEHPEDAARLLVTGRLDDPEVVAAHLRLCDVFLQPSMWDGLPNAVLEAMACGRCVIASDAGGIPEAIDHGDNGFLIPRARLHVLGEAVLELLDLPADERESLGAAARQRVEDHFHRDREAAALQQVLDRLLPR